MLEGCSGSVDVQRRHRRSAYAQAEYQEDVMMKTAIAKARTIAGASTVGVVADGVALGGTAQTLRPRQRFTA